jgi:hypothetical protein
MPGSADPRSPPDDTLEERIAETLALSAAERRACYEGSPTAASQRPTAAWTTFDLSVLGRPIHLDCRAENGDAELASCHCVVLEAQPFVSGTVGVTVQVQQRHEVTADRPPAVAVFSNAPPEHVPLAGPEPFPIPGR